MKFKFLIVLFIIFSIFSCSAYSYLKLKNMKNIKSYEILKNKENYYDKKEMKLYVNGIYVPVFWKKNRSVEDIKKQLEKEDINVSLKVYGKNEQFGFLKRSFIKDDIKMTTKCGDIVLYDGDKIVLFYAPNTWEYTKIGEINLSDEEIVKMLSDKDVSIKISFE